MSVKKVGSIYYVLSEYSGPCSVKVYFNKVREVQLRRNEDRIKVGMEVDWKEELYFFWIDGVEKLKFEADFSTFVGQYYEEVVLPDGRVFIQKKKLPNWEI